MAYGVKGSWRDIWHYIWKSLDKDETLTFEDFYNNPSTQRVLRDQFHNLGEEKTKERAREMFCDIAEQKGIACDEDEELDAGGDEGGDEGGDVMGESFNRLLNRALLREARAERRRQRLL